MAITLYLRHYLTMPSAPISHQIQRLRPYRGGARARAVKPSRRPKEIPLHPALAPATANAHVDNETFHAKPAAAPRHRRLLRAWLLLNLKRRAQDRNRRICAPEPHLPALFPLSHTLHALASTTARVYGFRTRSDSEAAPGKGPTSDGGGWQVEGAWEPMQVSARAECTAARHGAFVDIGAAWTTLAQIDAKKMVPRYETRIGGRVGKGPPA
ncbi:hypothetical protein B0H14DRAFT_3869482 [Mycena olivaceomarginata]|nr:hypothetical protein B0H14DRAFT_3869482 [Mycena olivaceomarginata]